MRIALKKIDTAIARIKEFEPLEGYHLAFSGGKDSQCLYHLAVMAGVKFDAHFQFTTCDPPELLQFIRDYYPDVAWEKPSKTMWQLIEEKHMPPTRLSRYCCQYLKERGGEGRFVLLGVRWAESDRRKKNRKMVELCPTKGKRMLSPIVDWSDQDVWNFIRGQHLPYCRLYDEGFFRIGCVGCPMGGRKSQIKEFNRWPNFKKAYLRAFEKMLAVNIERKVTNRCNWMTAEDVFYWWIMTPDRLQLRLEL